MTQFPDATVRRLLIALIHEAQSELGRTTGIEDRQRIAAMTFGHPDDKVDLLPIDDTSLGFDSIARLDLISRVNQFFQLSDTGAEDYLLISPSVGQWIKVVQSHLRQVGPDAAFAFRTSGSTGAATWHRHSLSDLRDEVDALIKGPLAVFGPSARIVALVPPHHIYGFLFTCLLPVMVGSDLLDLRNHAPTALARNGQVGDLVIGTPFVWQTIAKTGLALPGGLQGVTSGGPSTQDTWLQQGTGRPATMLEIYGATETGGIGFRTREEDGFTLLPHLTRSDAGDVLRRRTGNCLPLQDRLVWEGEKQFRLGGRLDHVIQVAGVNVNPAQVAATICAVDGVADATVRPDGDRLKGFVVPKASETDLDGLEMRIRHHMRTQLAAPARVGNLTFGRALPQSIMGKLCDWPTGDRHPLQTTRGIGGNSVANVPVVN